jgi:hypothetical protein
VVAALLAAPWPAAAFRWPWQIGDPWPSSSSGPVVTLDHPTVESAFADRAGSAPAAGPWRFVAFGDQRALADGEWQALLAAVGRWEDARGDVAFLLDTGDIVHDGRHADQFAFLAREILPHGPRLPYLVGVGNHETRNNDSQAARVHTARFLAYLDPALSPDRFWYRKDLGGATFLFLDTNDLVYGPDGSRGACPDAFAPGSREARQIAWLDEQLGGLAAAPARPVVVVMHHPFVQSSAKHREAARSLWNLRVDGTRLVDRFADAGVDVVLSGHTHTYERFRLERDDGAVLALVNVSGRPRNTVFWYGADGRRPHDIGGEETEALADRGWTGLDRWTVRQEDVMLPPDEADQFGVFTVAPDGGIGLEMVFLDDDRPEGYRADPPVRLP